MSDLSMVASIVRTTCGSGWSSNYAISFAKINRPLPQAVLTKSRTTRITGGVAKVGDKSIFGFTGTMRDHRRAIVCSREFNTLERFRQSTNLIHLDQNRVCYAKLNALA